MSILPSWSDGVARKAIVDFVERVTRADSPEFVPESARIATFDNDGTLWCEQPMQPQIYFTMARLKELASENPELASRQPFKAFLEHDKQTLATLGKKAVFEVGMRTHAGMTEEVFAELATTWFRTAKHPSLDRPFTRCVYRPQVELLEYLRQNAFKTFIVSGGGVDLIRAFAEEAYGIPSFQVIGSSVRTRLQVHDGAVDLLKLADIESFDDREVKVQNIGLHIGRRPILAVGNSDGDLAMMRYTKAGGGPRLALLVHHDDCQREFQYDRDFRLSPLAEALDRAEDFGFTVVSMKDDWRTIFAEAADARSRLVS